MLYCVGYSNDLDYENMYISFIVSSAEFGPCLMSNTRWIRDDDGVGLGNEQFTVTCVGSPTRPIIHKFKWSLT